jgi:hypothetical protein
MGEPNVPFITLEVLAFYPAEENPPPLPPLVPATIPGTSTSGGQSNAAQNSQTYTNSYFPPASSTSYPSMRGSVPTPRNASSILDTDTQIRPRGSSPPRTLPPPPQTQGSSYNPFGDVGSASLEKKRKSSMELRVSESKRRRGDQSGSAPDSSQGSTPSNVNANNFIDLTLDAELLAENRVP